MTARTARPAGRRTAVLAAAALAVARSAAAQSFPAQPGAYLLSATATDARALWVNPAILRNSPEASIGADLTATLTDGGLELSQLGLTLASRGLAFGWSRTEAPGAAPAGSLPAINTFALGFGLGDEVLSAGVARRWYRGTRKASAWELGARTRWRRGVELSLVWRDIGSPVVSPYRPLVAADTTLPARLVPGVGLLLFGGRLRLGAEWEATRGSVTRVARAGFAWQLTDRIAVMGRGDLSSRPEHRSLAVAAQWRVRSARATLYTAQPDLGDSQDLGAALQLFALPPPVRGRRP